MDYSDYLYRDMIKNNNTYVLADIQNTLASRRQLH